MPDVISAQFIGQSLHFGVNLFAALACLAAGWLYLDAWLERKHTSELAKTGGFMLLAIAFIINAAVWGNSGLLGIIADVLKLAGYAGIMFSNFASPLQPRPHTKGLTPEDLKPNGPPQPPTAQPNTPPVAGFWLSGAGITTGLSSLLPLAAFIVSFQYWRLATTGLERHLKPVAIAFTVFTISDLLALSSLWSTSGNPLITPLVDTLGPFWILGHILLFTGAFLLARWVWRYLTKRLVTQLFLVITALTFTVVLLATTSVSALLLSSLQRDSLTSLETATKVLSYALDSKTADTRINAEVLAKDAGVITGVAARDNTAITTITTATLTAKQLSEIIVTDDTGVVLSRASDPERTGDSLSNDALVQRALTDVTSSSLTARSGALAPALVITTASPIKQGGQIIGVSLASLALDDAFVDGLKHTTGLDSTIYSGDARAATTLTGPDGASRSIGIKETHAQVLSDTLGHGKTWRGIINVSNQSYLAVYLPLKDVNNTVVGMLFIGEPQDTVLSTAKAAIKLTFAGAALALLVIMFPVYAVARQISRQLH